MDYTTLKLRLSNLSSVQFHALGICLGLVAVIVFGAIGVPRSSIIQPLHNAQLPWRTEAPNTTFNTTSGDSIELNNLRGSNLGLVFMSPTCQYSEDLKRELTQTRKQLPVDQLFFISRGTGESNNDPRETNEVADGFTTRFSVVEDTTGEMFRAYKINGVPSAYWISETGVVVDFAVGFGPSLRLINRLANSR